jgi:hypothetical protein
MSSPNICLTDRVVLTSFAAACAVTIAALALPTPRAGEQVALVYPPWTSGFEALSRAAASGARLVRTGRYPFIVIADAPSAEEIRQLAESGAMATLGAAGLGGCIIRLAGAPT